MVGPLWNGKKTELKRRGRESAEKRWETVKLCCADRKQRIPARMRGNWDESKGRSERSNEGRGDRVAHANGFCEKRGAGGWIRSEWKRNRGVDRAGRDGSVGGLR